MKPTKYLCPKCGSNQCDISEIRVAGSLFMSIFDIQNKKFASVTCNQCSYTEFYKTDAKKLETLIIHS